MPKSARISLLIAIVLGCAGVIAFMLHARRPQGKHSGRTEADFALPAVDEASSTTLPAAPHLPGDWTLKFDDEFDEPMLAKIWTPHQYWSDGPTIGEGDEQSDPANVYVAGGMLRLTARRDRRFNTPYTGALVQAGGIRGKPSQTFAFLYGYAEARIRIPTGRGLWPAYWLMPASYHDANGEIDVIDNGTGNPNVLHGGALAHGRQDQHQHPSELAPGFHVFAVDWQPDHVIWYVDGKKWAHTEDRSLICAEPMYPIFDLAVGGKWGGLPNADTRFPAVMEVDWIRIWQRS